MKNTFVLQDYTRSDELWVTLSIGRVIVFEKQLPDHHADDVVQLSISLETYLRYVRS